MSKVFKIVGNDMSDGYHTFDELYEHRCLLFINLCLTCADSCRWKRDPQFGDWICLYYKTRRGQISYHVPGKHLWLFKEKITQDDAYPWDGHTSDDVVYRLTMLAEDGHK